MIPDDDVFIFVFADNDLYEQLAMFTKDEEAASDYASMFPDAIYFLAHVQEV